VKATLFVLLSVQLHSPLLAAQRSPKVRSVGARFIGISLPADILLSPEVRKHLFTGLTTSFVVRLSFGAGASRRLGGGRIDVRYEPWEEIFFSTSFHVDGTTDREKLTSLDRLVEWWQEARLKVLPLRAVQEKPARLRVDLTVLPFSASEERDAEKWLARSLEATRPEGSTPDRGASAGEGRESSHFLDTLLATSIKRRALSKFHWDLNFPAEAVP